MTFDIPSRPVLPRLVTAAAAAVIAAMLAPASGRAQAFNLEEQVQICAACHGENGIPQEKETPNIWGQHVGYAYLQLKDFKSKDRLFDPMNVITENYSRADMLALAEYFAAKPWPRPDARPADDEVSLRAARTNAAVGCTGCHQDQYKGEGTQARLAGQSRAYLIKTMLDIRTGARGNNAGMTTLMKATAEEDLQAMAEYLAGLALQQ